MLKKSGTATRKRLFSYLKANCWLSLQRTSKDCIGSFIMYYPCLPFTTLRAIKGRTTQESMPNYSRGYYVQLHCLLEIKMKALPPCGMLCAAQNNTKRNNLRCSFFPRRMMQDKTFPGCDFFSHRTLQSDGQYYLLQLFSAECFK